MKYSKVMLSLLLFNINRKVWKTLIWSNHLYHCIFRKTEAETAYTGHLACQWHWSHVAVVKLRFSKYSSVWRTGHATQPNSKSHQKLLSYCFLFTKLLFTIVLVTWGSSWHLQTIISLSYSNKKQEKRYSKIHLFNQLCPWRGQGGRKTHGLSTSCADYKGGFKATWSHSPLQPHLGSIFLSTKSMEELLYAVRGITGVQSTVLIPKKKKQPTKDFKPFVALE